MADSSTKININGYLVPPLKGSAAQTGYKLLLWFPSEDHNESQDQNLYKFPTDFENACSFQDYLFTCNDTATIKGIFHNDILRIKTSYEYDKTTTNKFDFEYICYSKKLVIVRLKHANNSQYTLK